ncbi:MAG: diphosphokinase / guanosine-3,5-bis(diphosphate) 3-diphosphatase, partial [Solirubrobacterales bacterium]|nr:diphosphokinase / guanosine-3,5-bis(diphosphate) 3-diphosphatase [Solirubrobacterales bacterium]
MSDGDAASAAPPEDRAGHTRVGVGTPKPPMLTGSSVTADLSAEERALLGDLLAVVTEHAGSGDPELDRDAVERAFAFSCARHADQTRRSGEDFITHPVEVAKICAGLRLDTETLCAALLHDTVEDTTASLEEVQGLFGESVSSLVDGVTKLTGITFQSRDEKQAE